MSLFVESVILAEERIDFQHDSFGKDIETLVDQLSEDIRTGVAKGVLNGYPVIKKLEQLIFKRLGLKVNIITNQHLAAIYPFYSNKNHIFLNEFLRGNLSIPDQNKAIKNFATPHGTVNLSSAKVSGIFSEYMHPLFINFKELISQGFATPEIAAIMLHELGHAFLGCYYSDRSDRTNQVLANVHSTLIGARTVKDLDYLYRELSKISDSVTKEEVELILNGPRVVAGVTWFKLMIRTVRSQMDNDKYSDTAFEEAADSFAGRFGYGKLLAVSLDRLHKDDFNKSRNALLLAYVMDFVVVGALVATVLGSMLLGSALVAMVSSIYLSAYFSFSGEDVIDYTYDDLRARHKRIRNGVVEELKNTEGLDHATIKNILDNIYALDEMIASTNVFRNIGTKINNLIFSNSRAAFNSIETQKVLEALSANDLFINSAELKTL